MSKIKILPDILSNKIAAGEVVERPASVVKELVENALDAGSTRIVVEIEKGGRSVIRVSDNGSGMNHDDALLSLERYATSKIYTDDDLFSIRTMGFRGEALPSIAAVSKFSMITRHSSMPSGTEITIEGGKIKNVVETGAPIGTMINIKQLFYNTPARRKFLKTIDTEMGHIADTMACMALGHAGIQFKLLHNEKLMKNWPRVAAHYDRVVDVLGHDLGTHFHEIQSEQERCRVHGWISSPQVRRSTSKKIYLFVNGRFIRDRGIQFALFEGYGGRLMKGQFPVAVLFITLPCTELDVNVHPTKHEVRFAHQKAVYDTIKNAVKQVWAKVDRPKFQPRNDAALHIPATHTRPVRHDRKLVSRELPFISHAAVDMGSVTAWQAENKDTHTDTISRVEETVVQSVGDEPVISDVQDVYDQNRKNDDDMMSSSTVLPPKREEIRSLADATVIGQFHNTYIVCDAGRELLLVDQHAAHERIVFEQLKRRAAGHPVSVQRLLLPETIEVNYSEAVLLEKIIPALKEMGLEIEPFGRQTFVVKALPALIANREVSSLIIQILERAERIGFVPDPKNPGLEKIIEECLILMACHGAIRANQRLSTQEMQTLLKQLYQCEIPAYCPHGRPTWTKWSIRELEKTFHRVV